MADRFFSSFSGNLSIACPSTARSCVKIDQWRVSDGHYYRLFPGRCIGHTELTQTGTLVACPPPYSTWAKTFPEETIGSLADAALDDGCVYLCAWGPGCDRVHDRFDMKIVDRDIAGKTPNALAVMTTSHGGETLDEATEFLITAAWPDDAFAETCRSALVAVVGNTDWVASVRRRFAK